ncbi:hypothetical protein VN97_g6557 [Penicillium thymicola]|uniref:Uncharacterized protein n=1 Tax=Penicillium thymicola TaxID=293382 RepID=A0AAI9TG62_PENTH|nr:hypothetical protein VN97_g6557 [Penicillium thymicola]
MGLLCINTCTMTTTILGSPYYNINIINPWKNDSRGSYLLCVVYPYAKAEINITCPPNKGPRNIPSPRISFQ